MLRSFFVICAAWASLCAYAQTAPQKNAFDKAELETYVRHLWVLGPEYSVQISDPQPADIAGLKKVVIEIAKGAAGERLPLFISDDGSKILQGTVYDFHANPFQAELDKLHTQFQPSLGTPGAPVVVVAFSDLQCPHCKDEAEMIRNNLIQNYPTQVRYYFKDFPLESIHPWAKAAAIAGRCVFRQDPVSFWDYHDWIFGNQDGITADTLQYRVQTWAKDRKELDSLQLTRCIDEKATEKEVDASIEEGRALGVDGTPTLFVNGRRLPGGSDWSDLKRIIDNELKYQETAKNAGEDCGCSVKLDAPGLPPAAPVIGIGEK